ncbi:MAG: c-type cytochrome [Bacillota bacterium]
MTRSQARMFAIVSTALVTIAFLGMTIDSHRKFPDLTHEDKMTPQVLRGKDVWHKFNCTNCHTLLGEGAYYAPDLTKIALQRGPQYLKAFLHDPSQFYDEQKVRRVMPKQNLSDQQIDDLVVFLDWIGHIDTQGWPPRRILVSGAAIPGTNMEQTAQASKSMQTAAPSSDPVAQGQALFNATPPACSACHSISPGVNLAGPSLAGIGTRAAQTVADPSYKGKAKDAAQYIHESIVAPSAHLVPGPTYSAGGRSFMPDNFGKELTPQQIDHLVAYLVTLK